MRPTEVKLNNPPEDAISAVKFGPKTNQYLIASAWDGTVRFYDVVNNAMRQKFVEDMPVMDVAFMVNSDCRSLIYQKWLMLIFAFRTLCMS